MPFIVVFQSPNQLRPESYLNSDRLWSDPRSSSEPKDCVGRCSCRWWPEMVHLLPFYEVRAEDICRVERFSNTDETAVRYVFVHLFYLKVKNVPICGKILSKCKLSIINILHTLALLLQDRSLRPTKKFNFQFKSM